MNIFGKIAIAFYCLCNWIVAAYKPIAALFSLRNQARATKGLYKTFSGILTSGSSSTLCREESGDLRMIAGTYTTVKKDKKGFSWWQFVAKSPSPKDSTEGVSSTAQYRTDSYTDSSMILSSLVMQSMEMSRAEREKSRPVYSFTDVAGFMEYDPKTAAKSTHKRGGGKSTQRHPTEWFRM